ncbi:ATP-binding cassette domain-containing protein [Ghiorsea bivora]|uniref:ATP-binding cassette domain-containing protein n=1 Tax=Ghiorsea bivora TaxID=1485545 RepID=UPI0009E09458|nr:ATP-binding cassette domain-containing protein [Ghiorsea bivora]
MNQFRVQSTLGNLQLDVQASFEAQCVVISGENGAGKTTLLRCLAGLQDCTGQIQVGGKFWLDSAAGFSKPTAARKLGFVWADAVLLPWLDVEKNIKFGVADEDINCFFQVCESLEVVSLLKRKPAMLSTGEAQRVALARALYGKPSLLLLDEPFSAQAPDIRARLRLALQALQQDLNVPMLLVSHDKEDAKVLANQHWHMREGKLLTSVTKIVIPTQVGIYRECE